MESFHPRVGLSRIFFPSDKARLVPTSGEVRGWGKVL